MSSTSLELGNARLLQLAEILDTADERHRERGEPTYQQSSYLHPCKTPACAAGHWAAANPDRWSIEDIALIDSFAGTVSDLESEFGLSDYCEIFGLHGCGNAQTAKAAADYIRAFVARRSAS